MIYGGQCYRPTFICYDLNLDKVYMGINSTSFPGPFPWLPQAGEKVLGTRLGLTLFLSSSLALKSGLPFCRIFVCFCPI